MKSPPFLSLSLSLSLLYERTRTYSLLFPVENFPSLSLLIR